MPFQSSVIHDCLVQSHSVQEELYEATEQVKTKELQEDREQCNSISCISCFLLSSWLAFIESINLCITCVNFVVLGIYLEPGVMATVC